RVGRVPPPAPVPGPRSASYNRRELSVGAANARRPIHPVEPNEVPHMAGQPLGELVPLGGGDTIPLVREVMTVGRRSTCDIHLNFPNVSGQHCEFSYKNGFWYVRDLGSQNGTKVGGERIMKRLLR